jgi:hypothetical protein
MEMAWFDSLLNKVSDEFNMLRKSIQALDSHAKNEKSDLAELY